MKANELSFLGTASKSSDSYHSEYRNQILRGSFKWMDTFFSLLDFYFLHCRLPSLILSIRDVLIIIQATMCSLWPYLRMWEKYENFTKIRTFLFFFDSLYFDESNLIIGIIMILVMAIFITTLLFCMKNYQVSHHYSTWNVVIVFIFVEIVFPISLIFVSGFFGYSISSFMAHRSLANQFSLFISLASMILVILATNVLFLAESRTVYLRNHIFSYFDSRIISSFTIHSLYFMISSILLNKFSSWVSQVVILANILYKIIYLPLINEYPFISKVTNGFFLSLMINNIVTNITIVTFYYYSSFNIIVALGIWFIFSLIIGETYYNKRVSNNQEKWNDTETQINNVISWPIEDESSMLFNLRSSFVLSSKPFIDLSYTKNIVQNSQTCEILCSCLFHIAFFPGETRLLNMLFSHVIEKRDLTFKDRFLLFQTNKIKILRQSSTTSEINEQLISQNNSTAQCESLMRGFWSKSSINLSYLIAVQEQISSSQSLWEESLRNYPNNPKFCSDYCNFLIEVVCDFENSIITKQRAEMIELGKRYSVDSCFLFFVETFPQYLKRKVVDHKGNFVGNNPKGPNPKSDQSESNSLTNDEYMDAEVEESIGKQLFDQTKLRLSLSRALFNRKPNSNKYLHNVFSIVLLTIAIVLSVYLLFSYSIIESKKNMFLQLFYLLKSRNDNSLSGASLLLHYCEKTGRLSNYSLIEKEMINESHINQYIGVPDNSLNLSLKWIKYSRVNFHELLSQIAIMSTNGIIIPEVTNTIINKGAQVGYCASAKVVSTSQTDLGTVLSYNSFVIEEILSISNQTSIFETDYFCEYIVTWLSFTNSVKKVIISYKEKAIADSEHSKDLLTTFLTLIPATLATILFLPVIVYFSGFYFEIKAVSSILLSLDEKCKGAISNKIRIDGTSHSDNGIEKQVSSSKWCRQLVIIILISLIAVIICVYEINFTLDSINDTKNLFLWELNSISRSSLISETLQHTILALVMNESIFFSVTNRTFHIDQTRSSVFELEKNNKELYQGNSDQDPCENFDSILDDVNLKETCASVDIKRSFFDYYKCAPINQAIGMYSTMIIEIIQKTGNFNGSLSFADMVYVLDIAGGFLFSRLEIFDKRVLDLFDINYTKLISMSTLISIVILIICIIWYIFSISLTEVFTSMYKVLIYQIKRIPPLLIIGNSGLMEIIMNKGKIEQKHEDSISGRIIQSSMDAIICSGLNNVVEIVNPSVSGLLGYTPEQLLGQSISLLFSNNDAEKITNQMNLMKNGQCSAVFSDHIECVTDSTTAVPCFLTILGMVSPGEGSISSFVCILKDEAELHKQQRECEIAKAKSEELLYQILPREIVMRINRGEKDVSFSVSSATIIFIDIVKFSEYSMHLPPQDILEHLSQIFSSFDSVAEKYPLITKIKLIGDVYMAASGLFCDVSGKQHAEQIVRFAIDILQELEVINVRLNASINVRIGINSGGPIIAGVLGTDKPIFDIIGDPINVAARLQATSLPGRIQISQSTYDLINEIPFEIEKRGEVFLKGKGNAMAYFVNTETSFFSQISSCEFKSSNNGINHDSKGTN